MTGSEIRADLLNAPQRCEAAISRAVNRSRDAIEQGGEPGAMGEKLLNALISIRLDQLKGLDYSNAEAIDRLRSDFGVSAEQFPDVLPSIRVQL